MKEPSACNCRKYIAFEHLSHNYDMQSFAPMLKSEVKNEEGKYAVTGNYQSQGRFIPALYASDCIADLPCSNGIGKFNF